MREQSAEESGRRAGFRWMEQSQEDVDSKTSGLRDFPNDVQWLKRCTPV